MPSALKTSTFLIILVALLAHGLVLLNDGVYWDGWVFSGLQADGDWDAVRDYWQGYGVPAGAYMVWLPGSPLGNKLVNFLSLLLAAIMIYHIGKKFLSPSESLLVALLSLVYPAFQYAYEYVATAILVPYAIFFVAVYVTLIFEEAQGWQRWAWRALALICFFGGAFWLNSLLAYYGGFALLLLTYQRRKSESTWREAIPKFVIARLDFLLLPVLFWIVRAIFFPPSGELADYNSFSLSPTIFYRVVEFINNGVIEQFNRALHMLVDFPIALIVILLMVAALHRIAWPAFHANYRPSESPLNLLAFALILFLLGILPYVLVGSTPLAEGTKTRFSLLIGLPVALAMLALIRDMERGFMVACFFIITFTAATASFYLDWQARWIHDRSVIVNLAEMGEPDDVSVIWIDSYFNIGPDERYRHYDWSSIFEQAWGDESRIGLDVGSALNIYVPERFTALENLSEFDATRCQAILTIHQGPRPESYNDKVGLSARYFVFRYLLRNQLDDYLRDVTRLELRRILAPQATNCAAQQAFLEEVSDDLFDPDQPYFLHTERIADITRLERSALAPFEPLMPLDASTREALEAGGFDSDFYQLYQTFGYNQ
jgi:hypothetical protein